MKWVRVQASSRNSVVDGEELCEETAGPDCRGDDHNSQCLLQRMAAWRDHADLLVDSASLLPRTCVANGAIAQTLAARCTGGSRSC